MGLEEEVERVNQQMKEEMETMARQKGEEVKRAREELEAHQERRLSTQQTQEKAREEYARWAANC